MAAATATAGRGKQSGQRSVFVQTEKQSDYNGQSAAVKNTGTECAVFRTENKQSDKDPKGYVTLGATIHKKPPVSCRRTYVFWKLLLPCERQSPCGFVFLIYSIPHFRFVCIKKRVFGGKKSTLSPFFYVHFVALNEKMRYNDIILRYTLGKYAYAV